MLFEAHRNRNWWGIVSPNRWCVRRGKKSNVPLSHSFNRLEHSLQFKPGAFKSKRQHSAVPTAVAVSNFPQVKLTRFQVRSPYQAKKQHFCSVSLSFKLVILPAILPIWFFLRPGHPVFFGFLAHSQAADPEGFSCGAILHLGILPWGCHGWQLTLWLWPT